ncbi:MAG: hypothetical protein FJ386_14680 [Verrucomicrobia bacterium]|nr:hypothetical protein [Verrucomicrobiota bacterium]
MTRHCWKCGLEWTLPVNPGRSESCHRCSSDVRVCLNCQFYDVHAAQQCRERRAEPVFDKHVGTFCEWFDFARRNFRPPGQNPREGSARDNLKKLLGD